MSETTAAYAVKTDKQRRYSDASKTRRTNRTRLSEGSRP